MTRTEAFEEVAIDSADSLWDWLGVHHGQDSSVWLVTHLKSDPDRYVSRGEVLDALIAHGWIDGIRRKRDDGRTMQLIAPRKAQHWAQSYKDRAERLRAEGRMHAAGEAAIARGKASGLWDFMADVDALIQPADLQQAFAREPGAQAHFDATAPSYQRNVLRWIKLAKTDGTRAKRIEKVAAFAARNERIPQM